MRVDIRIMTRFAQGGRVDHSRKELNVAVNGLRQGNHVPRWVGGACICVELILAFVSVATAAEPTMSWNAQPPDGNGLLINVNQPADEQPLELPSLEEYAEQTFFVPALAQEVTTVTRQASTIGRSSAAVFVITNEMIRRSGVRSIPEALRMAPGVQVAKINSNTWAISIRGFTSKFTNELLVQIDGRSVYSPNFGGTFWDVIDYPLEDIERIEVIRGPGASVWGDNAVNGVINIITKRARDTQGGLISGGGGSEEKGFSTVRYGGQIGSDINYRIYAKHFERDIGAVGLPTPNAFTGTPFGITEPHDDWRQFRTGMRFDWEPNSCDALTLQGDFYEGHTGLRSFQPDPTVPPPFTRTVDDDERVTGGNVMFRWTRQLQEQSNWQFQVYYDRAERHSQYFDLVTDTVDFDFQHTFSFGCNHQVIWGLGYRWYDEAETFGRFATSLVPPDRVFDIPSAFVQDEIMLVEDRLYFTAGCKFSHNDFSGFEYQPTGRLLWVIDERRVAWGAVSRAVATTPRVVNDLRFPGLPVGAVGPLPLMPFLIGGGGTLGAEDLLAFEAGYRAQPSEWLSWDLAVFYNDYNDMRGTTSNAAGIFLFPGPPSAMFIPTTFNNDVDVRSYGFEVSSKVQLTPSWRLSGNYSFLKIDLLGQSGGAEDQSPQNQAYLQLSGDLGCNWELDIVGRYVDVIPDFAIPPYITMDIRLGWHPNDCWGLDVVGQNLLHAEHPEFRDSLMFTGFSGTQVQRGVYGMITRKW